MPLNRIPVAASIRIGWDRLKHDSGRTIREGTVHNVRVSRYPAYVCSTEEYVIIANIKDVLVRGSYVEQIPTRAVQHPFRFSRRTTRVQHEERILRVHTLRLRFERIANFCELLFIGEIPTFLHRNWTIRSLNNQNLLYCGTLTEGFIARLFERNRLRSAQALVGSNQKLAPAVVDAIAQ